ncbi:MAG: hypothetical protein IPK19_22470 [Chloroflexi bacterium]|nr:hypothetical protein [Chloroflexota bacterium]
MASDTLLVLGIVFGAFGVLVLFFVYANRPRRRNRRFVRDLNGGIAALGGSRVGEPMQYEGTGKSLCPPTQLPAGNYVLSYELYSPTRIALVTEAGGSEQTILISTAVGIKEFSVASDGAYRWRIEPNAEESQWRMTVRPVLKRGR